MTERCPKVKPILPESMKNVKNENLLTSSNAQQYCIRHMYYVEAIRRTYIFPYSNSCLT